MGERTRLPGNGGRMGGYLCYTGKRTKLKIMAEVWMEKVSMIFITPKLTAIRTGDQSMGLCWSGIQILIIFISSGHVQKYNLTGMKQQKKIENNRREVGFVIQQNSFKQ